MNKRVVSEAPDIFKSESIYKGDRIRARICEFDKDIVTNLEINKGGVSRCFIENCDMSVKILYNSLGAEAGRFYRHFDYPRPLKIPKKKQKEIDQKFGIKNIKTLNDMRENMKLRVRTAIKEHKIVSQSGPYKG